MNKKLFIALAFVVGSFQLIILQYKVTQMAMKVPAVEEEYLMLVEETESLELKLHGLKNPSRLLAHHEVPYSFPKNLDVYAVHMEVKKPASNASVSSKSALPIAQIFP